MSSIQSLQSVINESRRIVIFSGAGVSTESGIPDFRSADGLYKKKEKTYPYPPETMLSHTFFLHHTDMFFEYYRDKMVYPNARPNASHYAAAALEKCGKLSAVVTQNIDGLYQQAGCKRVLELHGSVLRNTCAQCGKKFALEDVLRADGVPRCDCGGVIKPDVVLYEESLDEQVIEDSVRAIEQADCLIVAGTSLTVYPAAGFVRYFRGSHFVLINRDKTPMDGMATLVLRENVGEVFSKLSIGDGVSLEVLPWEFTVCKLADTKEIDPNKDFYFLSKTEAEISLVCKTADVPNETTAREDGWRAFRIAGILDFSLTGVLSKLSAVLAENAIGIFAVSTYNTDYILVKAENLERALRVLCAQGYTAKAPDITA